MVEIANLHDLRVNLKVLHSWSWRQVSAAKSTYWSCRGPELVFGTVMVATGPGNLMPVLTIMRFCMHTVNTQAYTHAHNFLKLHSINVSRDTERPEVQTSG